VPTPTKPAMLRDLARVLVEQRAAGRRVIAVIDEAQNLSHDALEELRMLSNLETEKSKLIQIVLVGQPDLRDTLELPTLEQLRQRVTVRYHIEPLDAMETARYINHRLKRAAVGAPMEFPHDVTEAVHARSGGVPRLINVICDAVLLCGYAEERRLVDLDLVHTAVEELELSSILRRPRDGARAETTPRPPSTPPPPPVPQAPPPQQPMRASFDDLPLRRERRDAPEPSTWEQRQPVGAGARGSQVLQARAATAPRSAAVAVLPRETARPHPTVQRASVAASFQPSRPRPAGAWTYLKEVFFGPGPETGRR
jgi:AAA domain-containing protein